MLFRSSASEVAVVSPRTEPIAESSLIPTNLNDSPFAFNLVRSAPILKYAFVEPTTTPAFTVPTVFAVPSVRVLLA